MPLICKRIILWFLVLVCMASIFVMSAQNAEESTQLSGDFIESVVRFIYPHFFDITREEQLVIIDSAQNIVRKCAHAAIYCLLAVLTAAAVRTHDPRYRKILMISLCICAAYAISDEIHQYFVPGRGPGVIDVLIDTSGAAVGAVAYILTVRLHKRRNPKALTKKRNR